MISKYSQKMLFKDLNIQIFYKLFALKRELKSLCLNFVRKIMAMGRKHKRYFGLAKQDIINFMFHIRWFVSKNQFFVNFEINNKNRGLFFQILKFLYRHTKYISKNGEGMINKTPLHK